MCVHRQQCLPAVALCAHCRVPSPQAKHRLLRRTARVLAAAQGDPVLAGLHQHVSASSLPQLNAALAAAVQTHEQLGAAFREGIADGGFGVIWRAFRLMCRLWRTKVTAACRLALWCGGAWHEPRREQGLQANAS